MSSSQKDLENSIQLALEAATAANDAADDVVHLSSETQAAADRLDGFAKVMKPAMIGVLAGAILAIGLGGLVYVRTLSDMRAATATQIEALTLFSGSVADLQAQLEALEGVNETLAALAPAQQTAFQELQAKLDGQFAELRNNDADEDADGSQGLGNPASAAQMLRSLSENVQTSHTETRNAFTAGLSDLQLALTRMLADSPLPEPAAKKPVAQKKARVSAPSRSTGRRAPAEPNPFSYP